MIPGTFGFRDKALRNVCGIHRRDRPDKPAPWPYETVRYTLWDTLWDRTPERFDENSRIIVVDGNIGVGKSYLAKKLAEELDMLLFPEPTMDFMYIDDTGFDLR